MDSGKTIYLFFLLLSPFIAAAEPGQIAWSALQEYRENTSKDVCAPIIREVFSGISDDEIINEIYNYLLAEDKALRGTSFEMPLGSATPFISMIRNDPDLISDFSHLRNLLKNENDPRKFFLLSRLAIPLAVQGKTEFSAEMKHMLLKKGKASNVPPDRSREPYDVISKYAYSLIVEDLKRLNVNIPFEEFKSPTEEDTRKFFDWIDEGRRNREGAGSNRNKRNEKNSEKKEGHKESGDSQDSKDKSFYTVVLWTAVLAVAIAVATFVRSWWNKKNAASS